MFDRLVLCLLCATALPAQPLTDLWLRGYSVIPTPRKVQLDSRDIVVDSSWRIDAGSIGNQHIAVRTLIRDLEDFHGLRFHPPSGGVVIRLAIQAGAVKTGREPEIDRQAYRVRISQQGIEVTANGDAGLLYGAATVAQLLRRDNAGRLTVPEGQLEDWPQYQLRFLHWDTKHHQDRMETLKRYLDWSARMKINMIGFELEDKFSYPSHPVIGAPGAFTPEQLQEIVDYGLERFIQVVPVIQSPAHMAYVLKHPEFADLRDDGNNYQIAMCDARAYPLIFSMYEDVIKATRGVDYFFVSTDEMYYAGIGKNCAKPYNEENRSLQWVNFAQAAEKFLSARNRRMLAWVEYPLLPEHAKLLPRGIIDGVVGEEEYLPAEKELGIRQLAYNSMQGATYLFPNPLATGGGRGGEGQLAQAFHSILTGRHTRGNPIGVFGAAWDDSGLHNETFWLGWSAIAQYAWTPGTPSVDQHIAEFMNLYYGPGVTNMFDIYRTLQTQSRSWERSWDREVSKVRGPGYGNSYGKGRGTERHDLTLTPPAIPALPDLAAASIYAKQYAGRVAEARVNLLENERLAALLQENVGRASRNRYNLEVFLALTRFTGAHWHLLTALAGAEQSFEQARREHEAKRPARAVGHMVAAYNRIGAARKRSAEVFEGLQAVYEKSRYPKGQSVGGRKFVHVLDDTKDHWADRTADLTFMIAPEKSIGLDEWQKKLNAVIREYAKIHNVPVRGLAEARLEE